MTTSERWERVKDIFESALGRTGGERRAYLEGACGNDAALLREVESLLASFDADYLEGAAVEVVADAFAPPAATIRAGTMLGQYEIVSEIGKGGQGAVYKATDTKLGRTVAIKTLPPELNIDETARKRFHREARIASALDHPNICGVHDLVEADGMHFIVMPFVEGANIRDLVGGKPLDLKSALRIGIQVCDALAAAHDKQVIHRDIKAQNIIITPGGSPKILDFGLAKLTREGEADVTELTALGSPYGTPTYAAPEQSRGERVDHRADIFSTGVLLYEMLTGTWAFHGKTAIDVRHAVLHDEPVPIERRRGEAIPSRLKEIVDKALEKTPSKRFRSAADMRDELIAVLREMSPDISDTADEFLTRFGKPERPTHFVSSRTRRRRFAIAALILVSIAGGTGYFIYRQRANIEQARADLQTASELVKQRRYVEAYDLTQQAAAFLPDDPAIAALMPVVADELTVTSSEPGASVFLRRHGSDAERKLIGTTPIDKFRIARGEYLLDVELEGFAPFKRTFTGQPEYYWDISYAPPPTTIDVRMIPLAESPNGMVYVPGGSYQLASWKRPVSRSVDLSDFFIDRYEVSNREFREFVSAGGYLRGEFWVDSVAEGDTQDNTTQADLKDKTGLPGPRTWINQTFPENKGDHPVTDINWREAAAYARFRGKSLPTIFQWEKAARNGTFTHSSDEVMPWGYFRQNGSLAERANIAGRDTVAVSANEFGASPFGCQNMAGNVAEWCLNRANDGFMAAGGSWAEPTYAFGAMAVYPDTFSSSRLGFRCVKNLAPAGPDAADIDVRNDIPKYRVTTQAQFEQLKSFYRYDKTPVNARIIESVDTDDWRREKIEYRGPGDEMALAYLYLPRNAAAPYQAITYMPAGDVYGGYATVPQHVEAFAASQIRGGRAVFALVLRGFLERADPPGTKPAPSSSVRFRDRLIQDTREMQLGLDYLETRSDIDTSKIAFWGYSAGTESGMIFTAIENRLKTAIYMATGISMENARRLDEANIANFAPHIRIPKLVILGRYDEEYSWTAESEPLFKLFTGEKELVQYDAGHTPPPEIAVPVITKWLDQKLGPVKR